MGPVPEPNANWSPWSITNQLALRVERAGPLVIMARARDAAGNTQPMEPVWNPRGYCNNQVQRVGGTVIA